MTSEDLRTCWICGTPQPGWPGALHLRGCPEHDEETCAACLELAEQDEEQEQKDEDEENEK